MTHLHVCHDAFIHAHDSFIEQCTSAAKLNTSIESTKDGKVSDTRYKGPQILFAPPHIIYVFANNSPDFSTVLTNNLTHFSWLSARCIKTWTVEKEIVVQGGEDTQDALSVKVVFRKRAP